MRMSYTYTNIPISSGGNWQGGGFDQYHKSTDDGLFGLSMGIEVANAAFAIVLMEEGVKVAKTLAPVTRGLGWAGAGIMVSSAVYEYNTGHANTHTLVDIGVSVVSGIGVGFAISLGFPVVAGGIILGGIGYGVASFVGGGDMIDEWSNNYGKEFFYGDKR